MTGEWLYQNMHHFYLDNKNMSEEENILRGEYIVNLIWKKIDRIIRKNQKATQDRKR
jgi:hypothetical protein